MSEDVIKKHLKSREFARLYLIYGEEEYLKRFYCGKIAACAVAKGMESFNLHRFDMENFDVPHFVSAIENMPLMSEYKCIVLRDIDYDGMRAAEWKEFSAALKDIPEQTIVIVWYDADKAEKKSGRFKALQALARKNGVDAEIPKPSPRELDKWLRKIIAANGCTISDEALSYLVEFCGTDMNMLLNETEKICAYAAGGEIKKEHIDDLGIKPLNASIYELSRAIIARKPQTALKLIDEYFYKKEEPVIILATLSGAFCDLLRAKAALGSGAGQKELTEDFNYRGKEFRAKNALRDCRNLSAGYIDRCVGLLFEADKKLKGGRADKRLVLEQLIVEMCGESGGLH